MVSPKNWIRRRPEAAHGSTDVAMDAGVGMGRRCVEVEVIRMIFDEVCYLVDVIYGDGTRQVPSDRCEASKS